MKFIIIFTLVTFLEIGGGQSNAEQVITFGPEETKLVGSIPYTVLGQYQAQFKVFKGRMVLDEKDQVRSVDLMIEANSIESNCPWCDKIARSRRLLYTARYPKIIFKSDQVIKDKTSYKVKGTLEMHGIRRRMVFPFKGRIVFDPNAKGQFFDLKGNWIINRKDFNIVWNKWLDKGGVLVGDHFTVSWEIKVSLKALHSRSSQPIRPVQ